MRLTLNTWGLGTWVQCWPSAGAAVFFATSVLVVLAVVLGPVVAELGDQQRWGAGESICTGDLRWYHILQLCQLHFTITFSLPHPNVCCAAVSPLREVFS